MSPAANANLPRRNSSADAAVSAPNKNRTPARLTHTFDCGTARFVISVPFRVASTRALQGGLVPRSVGVSAPGLGRSERCLSRRQHDQRDTNDKKGKYGNQEM